MLEASPDQDLVPALKLWIKSFLGGFGHLALQNWGNYLFVSFNFLARHLKLPIKKQGNRKAPRVYLQEPVLAVRSLYCQLCLYPKVYYWYQLHYLFISLCKWHTHPYECSIKNLHKHLWIESCSPLQRLSVLFLNCNAMVGLIAHHLWRWVKHKSPVLQEGILLFP